MVQDFLFALSTNFSTKFRGLLIGCNSGSQPSREISTKKLIDVGISLEGGYGHKQLSSADPERLMRDFFYL
jgi:hypothetical protein